VTAGVAAGLDFLAVAVVAALVPLRDQVRNSNLALVLVLVVLAAAVIGGRIAGMAVGVAVAIAFDSFLTRPYQALRDEAWGSPVIADISA
jgi:K+-sensing histidine kinase KdpD